MDGGKDESIKLNLGLFVEQYNVCLISSHSWFISESNEDYPEN